MDNAEFYFPYHPYQIQVEFIQSLYKVLEGGGVGLFQSPTGTGKTMSIICGSLKWLMDHEARLRDSKWNTSAESVVSEDPDWLRGQLYEKCALRAQSDLEKQQQILSDIDAHDQMLKKTPKCLQRNDRHFNCRSTDFNCGNQDDFKEWKQGEIADKQQLKTLKNYITKIYYCSRTHTQLSQFITQFKQTKYKSHVRTSTLASRQLLCIHPKLNKIADPQLINDKCKKYRGIFPANF
ncbi:putative ATP-dependent RNA helicase DDX11-like protein 8 [Thelohanellus kitauei]|uniref:Putative ATP-dependent RNA helicase DDX11-like protein 8 n=1 Tax=Thelohanellus kitauei TaxID=669202 RepID=A0A0C2NF39_THEKT|nr:putative ATP-dependent RNA helicase DDX11-like protein 8 [Thelohanellus kitauei]